VIFVDRERPTNEDREEPKELLTRLRTRQARLVLYDAEVGPIGGFADVRHRRRGGKGSGSDRD